MPNHFGAWNQAVDEFDLQRLDLVLFEPYPKNGLRLSARSPWALHIRRMSRLSSKMVSSWRAVTVPRAKMSMLSVGRTILMPRGRSDRSMSTTDGS